MREKGDTYRPTKERSELSMAPAPSEAALLAKIDAAKSRRDVVVLCATLGDQATTPRVFARCAVALLNIFFVDDNARAVAVAHGAVGHVLEAFRHTNNFADGFALLGSMLFKNSAAIVQAVDGGGDCRA